MYICIYIYVHIHIIYICTYTCSTDWTSIASPGCSAASQLEHGGAGLIDIIITT